MSAVDPGLTDAVQRVTEARRVHGLNLMDERCRCGDGPAGNYGAYLAHRDEMVARAARVDVPALTQQARADELEALAGDWLHIHTDGLDREGTRGWPEPKRDAYALAIEEASDALRARAAAIQEGGQ